MMNKKIKFTTSTLNAVDLIPKTCNDWVLNSAKHIQVENTDNYPKIDSRILEKSIFDEYSLDDFDWNQFIPYTKYVDDMVEYETGLVEKVMFDEFRANGYDTPEKIKYLFEVDWYMLGRMIENINNILKTYYEHGVIHICNSFSAPAMPIKVSDKAFDYIGERMGELYGTVSE